MKLLRKWLLTLTPCPICEGGAREMIDYGNGDIRDIPCSMCDGKGTWKAYKARRDADIAAINAPPRCGCPECSGEWDRY